MRKRALVVGIDCYEKLNHLKGCVSDARKVAEKLQSPEYGFDVQLLTDDEVTRKALRSSINTLLANTDFSLLYFAGHGIRTSVSTFFATVDSEWDDEGVDIGYLVGAVSKLTDPKQTVVAVLDCCHAGDASLTEAALQYCPMSATDVPSLAGSGRLVMAACLGDQKAKEGKLDGEAHGKFTYHFLDALSGMAADKDSNVTVSSVYEHIASSLEKSGSQRPMLRGDQSGRVILGAGVQPTGNRSALQTNYVKDEIIREAEEHVSRYFDSVQQVGLKGRRDFRAGRERRGDRRRR